MREYEGEPRKCIIEDTQIDVSMCNIRANKCLSNSITIAQQYPNCNIVEGVLRVIDTTDGEVQYFSHVWNHDLQNDVYFDKTIIEDEKLSMHKVIPYLYTHYICVEYPYADRNQLANVIYYQYTYKNTIDKLKSQCMNTLKAEELHQEGVRLYKGEETDQNVAKSIECFEQAIALGSTKSKRALAYILLGEKSAWDAQTNEEKRGVHLYEEAAAEGDKLAMEWFVLQYGTMTSVFKLLKGEPAKQRAALAEQYRRELTTSNI